MHANQNREISSTASPFLNNYKRDFVFKRLLQTLLGGFILKFNQDIKVPWFIFVLQIVLFIIPFLIGGIFILIHDLINSNNWNLYFSIIAGGIYFLFLILVKIVAIIFTNVKYIKSKTNDKNNTKVNKPYKKTGSNLLNDEQNYKFDKLFSMSTLEFILPIQNIIFIIYQDKLTKKFDLKKFLFLFIRVLIDSLLSGLIMFCGVYFESIIYLQKYYSLAPTIILFILHWIVLLITFYSLNIREPPEPAIYQPDDHFNIVHYSRAFYVICFQLIELIYNFSPNNAEIPFLVIFYLKIFFTCLPIAWFLGLLPPVDAFILWFLEQCYVIVYGGTPTATNLRLLIQLVLSLVLSMVHFIPNDVAIVVLLSSFGYLFGSIDFIFLFEWLKYKYSNSKNSKITPLDSNRNKTKNIKEFPLNWKDWLFHLTLFIITIVVSVVIFCVFNANFVDKETPFLIEQILLYISIGLLVIIKIFGDLQSVYIFFGLIRNPFYPKNSLSLSLNKKSGDPLTINQNKLFFKVIKYSRTILIRIVSPLLLCAVVSIDCHLNKIYGDKILSYWRTICVLRAFRWIWQSNYNCLLEMCSTHIILFSISYNASSDKAVKLGLIQYFLTGCLAASFIRDRLNQLINKMYAFFLITITSWTIKKQRRRLALLFLILNFILLIPILALVLIPASLLSAPLLPLFTFPFFMIGFPRSKKFWPQKEKFFSNSINFLDKKKFSSAFKSHKRTLASSSSSTDSCFYIQLVPELLSSLKEMIISGSLSQSVEPDMFYLSRFQDRILWIQVMESSSSYCILNIKGLELQETSCHTREAQYIDDLFDLDFENPFGANSNTKSKNKFLKLNKKPFNCLSSKDVLLFKAYSDAKNSLVGILDYPDNLNMIFNFYPKILHYFLICYLIDKNSASNKLLNESKISLKSDNYLEMDPIIPNEDNTSNQIEKENETIYSAISKKNVILKKQDSLKKLNHEASFDEWSDTENESDKETKPKNKTQSRLEKDYFETDPFDFDLDQILGTSSTKKEKNFPIKQSEPIKQVKAKSPIPDMKIQRKKSPRLPNLQSTIQLPSEWLSFLSENINSSQSFNNEELKKSISNRTWLKKLVDIGKKANSLNDQEKILTDYETNLWTSHYKFLLKCCQILGINEKFNSQNFNTQAIHNIFKGDLPWSPVNEKLTKNYSDLHRLLTKSFQYCIKMIIDHATISPISDDNEFLEVLESYEQEWFIGYEDEKDFSQNILNSKPFIFSLHKDQNKKTLNSRTLSLQQIRSPLAKLNSEIVKSIWSSTNLELLYMTNDDEERYSIQAHAYILRNLTIQSSDPPLGYSVYNSENIYLSLVNPF